MKQYIVIAGILLTSATWFLAGDPEPLSPEAFAAALASERNELLIDLRRPADFSAGHIPGALNIHRSWRAFKWRIAELDTSRPVFLYSGSGECDAEVEAYLRSNGFVSVTSLQGGFTNWCGERLATTPPELIPPPELTADDLCSLLELEHLVLVDFYIPWDKRCRETEPVLDDIAVKYRGKLKILRINTDTYKYLATELGIDTVPVLHFYENGNLTATIEGVAGAEQIEQTFSLDAYSIFTLLHDPMSLHRAENDSENRN